MPVCHTTYSLRLSNSLMDFLLAAEDGQRKRKATGVSGTARTVYNSEQHLPLENPRQNPSTSGAVLQDPGMSEEIPGSTPNSGFGVEKITSAVVDLIDTLMLEIAQNKHGVIKAKCNENKGAAKRQAAQMIATFKGLLGTPGCKVFAVALNTALTTGLNADETMLSIHTIFTTESISLELAVAKVCADIISNVFENEISKAGFQKEKLTAEIVQALEKAKEGPIFRYLVMGMFETVKALVDKYRNSRQNETNNSADFWSEFGISSNIPRSRSQGRFNQQFNEITPNQRELMAILNFLRDD